MSTISTQVPNSVAGAATSEFAGLRVHLIGVGGSGMFGAARLLLDSGAQVSGSDQNPFDGSGDLVADGAAIRIGHAAGHVDSTVQLVVASAAVPDTNPEIEAARRASIRVIRYAELLGQITRSRRGVAVAGTHGKSTTTALTAHLLQFAGLSPSFIVGAESPQLGGSSGVGAGPHFVVESCEYARSFHHLFPHSAAILNIEADHLDCYRDLADIVDAFGIFARQVDSNGLLVVNHDDRFAKQASRHAACEVTTVGFGPGAHWRATNLRSRHGCYSFMLNHRGRPVQRCTLKIAGQYNVANTLAAVALADHAGVELELIAAGVSRFAGVHRRMTLRGSIDGVTVIDDYAHHPTEIKVTLEALRARYAPRRTWVVFQPHQASRTRQMMDSFSESFDDADVVLIPDIYSVRDSHDDVAAVNSPALVERIAARGTTSCYLPTFKDICDHLRQHTAPGDLVVTMGAGDVYKVADGLVGEVHSPSAA